VSDLLQGVPESLGGGEPNHVAVALDIDALGR
jgi:hypothetical protein